MFLQQLRFYFLKGKQDNKRDEKKNNNKTYIKSTRKHQRIKEEEIQHLSEAW